MIEYQRKSQQELEKLYEEELKLPLTPSYLLQEKCYRRGYAQGFWAARNSNVSEEVVMAWRHYGSLSCPPGSPMEGQPIGQEIKEA